MPLKCQSKATMNRKIGSNELSVTHVVDWMTYLDWMWSLKIHFRDFTCGSSLTVR